MGNHVSVEIPRRQSFADGQAFGDAGAYERLDGWATFLVDPSAPAQAGIVDLDKAPVNPDGLVECATEICILRPVDAALGNRRMFFDYGNRGNKRALQYFNDALASNEPISAAHAGNGYLFRRGYTVVWGAWQGDLLPGSGRMTMCLPTAGQPDNPVTGPLRTEFIATAHGQTTFPLSGWISTRSHPTVSRDTSRARLTRRRYPDDARQEIAPDAWSFARVEGGLGMDFQGAESAIVASDTHIHMPGGFEAGWIYELIYTGRDPLVMALGHLVVRDLTSFLKYDRTAANPLADHRIEKVYCFGRSQTGRCIRDALYRGFNSDAAGRKVFDGVLNHVAGAGRMWLNHRFANAVVPAGQQYEDHDNISDSFPFAYAESTDHLTGVTDAICKRPKTDPLIFHSQTGTEYWQRRGSLAHTDSRGADLPPPDNVRFYFWSSAQHVGDPNQGPPKRGICQNLNNVVQTSMLFRAMLDNLDRWCSDGAPPPDSRYPKRADNTLVTMQEWRRQFPSIPGQATPREPNRLPLYDYGPQAADGVLTVLPPTLRDAEGYTVLVPAVDADGNDLAGVRVPMVQAPLATYTGWNLRARPFGEGAMHEFTGSMVPLGETDAVCRATGDPRASIEARYGDASGYATAIEKAARDLIKAGLMLEEDLERTLEMARNWGAPWHDVRM
ncbi:MAG: alpha/beta hydrolase domain-containing protein [Proteobacteria bacterium]|nr:alpha/beta hydrolase domain-containing protein [Pseudomonadota bacterium]